MHLIPVVDTIRLPCTVTASAPPRHSAFTTAWMSCWWTTKSLSRTPDSVAASRSSGGESVSVTVTPSPDRSTMPAGSSTRSIWRR